MAGLRRQPDDLGYDAWMDIGIFVAMEPHNRSAADDYAAFIDLAQASEELGYKSIWITSRHFSAAYAAAPSPLALFAAAAARTKTIVLGTAVVTLPLENPIRLAEDFATLDALSGGRVCLGLGSGDDEPAFRAMGIPFDKRAQMLSELLPKFLEMLSKGRVGEARLYPEVSDPLPKVALGAQSKGGAGWAGSLGIGLLQGRAEPKAWDPTESQAEAASAYRSAHPSGWICTARNAWIGTLEDPDLLEGLRRHDEYLKSRGREGLPHESGLAMAKLNIIAGEPDELSERLRSMMARIRPDELAISVDPGGLEAGDRLHRLALMAKSFGLSGS
ncbi:MAG: LLM class flavin-dependent oxidoreductase [Actinomycetota bacterium]|nr:LLM class flavin-dependent oxidoreductase [Actinomycetota bacterium]